MGWAAIILGGVGGFLVGGPIGAAAGAAILGGATSFSRFDGHEEGKKEGIQEGDAKCTATVEKIEAQLNGLRNKFSDTKDYFDAVIVLYAIGIAAANIDGKISEEELQDIDEFVAGVSSRAIPPIIKSKIIEFRNNPPSISTAMSLLKNSPQIETIAPMIYPLIKVVVQADGIVGLAEQQLLEMLEPFKELQ